VRAAAALLIVTTGLWLSAAIFPAVAHANDLQDFQQAVQAYESNDYPRAVTLFERLVGDPVPRLQTPALVLESRKYLAVSYLFTGRTAAAEEQFQWLLEQDPGYQLDPLGFPAEVEQAFSGVKDRLRRERVEADARRAEAEAEARVAESERLLREHERSAEILRLAETTRVERVNSRWLAALPFGVGQFQNGHTELGYALAVGEGVLAVTVAGTWIAHAFLRAELDRIQTNRDVSLEPSEIDRANFQVELARTTNRVSFALLMTVMAIGVVDAQWRFKPTIGTEERRPLPEHLRSTTQISLGPGGLALRVSL